jgi:hypothetical protein
MFSQSAARLRRSAQKFGYQVDIYSPTSPPVLQAYRENQHVCNDPSSRGAGLWVWKPYIILDALRSGAETVLYTDVAVTVISDPARLLAVTEARDVSLFQNRLPDPQSKWCKRDAFVLLNADNPEEWNRPQLDAAFIVCRNTPRAIAFLNLWRDAMKDPRVVTDIPNTCGKSNLDGFVRHLNDQSVLTILAAKAGIQPLPSPSLSNTIDAPYPQIWHHHKRRNTHPLRQLWWWATGMYDGRWRVPHKAHPKFWY